MQQGEPLPGFQFSQQMSVKEGLARCYPLCELWLCYCALCKWPFSNPYFRSLNNRYTRHPYIQEHICLFKDLKKVNDWFCCFHRFDSEDEMEPEIEEAYETFCLEAEMRRKQ